MKKSTIIKVIYHILLIENPMTFNRKRSSGLLLYAEKKLL